MLQRDQQSADAVPVELRLGDNIDASRGVVGQERGGVERRVQRKPAGRDCSLYRHSKASGAVASAIGTPARRSSTSASQNPSWSSGARRVWLCRKMRMQQAAAKTRA